VCKRQNVDDNLDELKSLYIAGGRGIHHTFVCIRQQPLPSTSESRYTRTAHADAHAQTHQSAYVLARAHVSQATQAILTSMKQSYPHTHTHICVVYICRHSQNTSYPHIDHQAGYHGDPPYNQVAFGILHVSFAVRQLEHDKACHLRHCLCMRFVHVRICTRACEHVDVNARMYVCISMMYACD
jgi:hypothetical protein